MAQTISAIANLLWPLLVLVLLLIFRAPLARVVRSAEQREWTLEVGGQKLTMKQLSDQQNTMIADLQKQLGILSQAVAELTASAELSAQRLDHGRPDTPESPPQTSPQTPTPGTPPVPGAAQWQIPGGWGSHGHEASAHAVLWVDDHPENNALLVEQLQRNGVRVDLARSTREATALFGHRRYGMIVSDMGRFEDGAEVPDAGLRLLEHVRRTDQSVPFVIYCSSRAAAFHRDRALAEGATAITGSPAIVSEELAAVGLL